MIMSYTYDNVYNNSIYMKKKKDLVKLSKQLGLLPGKKDQTYKEVLLMCC
jgi:hypothetical protein